MKKKDTFLISTLTFFMGIAVGFLLAPMKEGIGNNVGNNTYNYFTDEEQFERLVAKNQEENEDE